MWKQCKQPEQEMQSVRDSPHPIKLCIYFSFLGLLCVIILHIQYNTNHIEDNLNEKSDGTPQNLDKCASRTLLVMVLVIIESKCASRTLCFSTSCSWHEDGNLDSVSNLVSHAGSNHLMHVKQLMIGACNQNWPLICWPQIFSLFLLLRCTENLIKKQVGLHWIFGMPSLHCYWGLLRRSELALQAYPTFIGGRQIAWRKSDIRSSRHLLLSWEELTDESSNCPIFHAPQLQLLVSCSEKKSFLLPH